MGSCGATSSEAPSQMRKRTMFVPPSSKIVPKRPTPGRSRNDESGDPGRLIASRKAIPTTASVKEQDHNQVTRRRTPKKNRNTNMPAKNPIHAPRENVQKIASS